MLFTWWCFLQSEAVSAPKKRTKTGDNIIKITIGNSAKTTDTTDNHWPNVGPMFIKRRNICSLTLTTPILTPTLQLFV